MLACIRVSSKFQNCIRLYEASRPSGYTVGLGGLVVIILAIGSNVRGLKPVEDDRFLRAIKIRSTTAFTGEVKTSVPCRKISQHEKYY
jgi:hypothetical protein